MSETNETENTASSVIIEGVAKSSAASVIAENAAEDAQAAAAATQIIAEEIVQNQAEVVESQTEFFQYMAGVEARLVSRIEEAERALSEILDRLAVLETREKEETPIQEQEKTNSEEETFVEETPEEIIEEKPHRRRYRRI